MYFIDRYSFNNIQSEGVKPKNKRQTYVADAFTSER